MESDLGQQALARLRADLRLSGFARNNFSHGFGNGLRLGGFGACSTRLFA
jgi:hypothetical protein